jgi:glycosyltransferase involved in cell wall biosynthesis
MKVLAVSQFYTPDITAAAFRISETVSHLREMDNEIEVVTTFPHKGGSTEEVPSSRNGVHRVQLPDTENKGFLGYIYLYLSFLVKSVLKGYSVGYKQKPDVVWASSPPIFVGLAGWLLAKLLGVSFALDIRDIWPDSAVAAGQLSDSGFAYKVGRGLEKFLYRHADVITCVAQPMKDYIQQFTDTGIEVIYNGVEVSADQNEIPTGKTDHLEEAASSESSKKILYAGNFGHVQQLDLLIDAFADIDTGALQEEWELFFVGGGAKEEGLTSLVESYELTDKIHFLGFVPKKDVFDYLKSADVLFIHLQDSEVLRLTIPSKVFDYMLADRPLLAGIHGEGKEIIDSVEGNAIFKSGNKQSLIKAWKELDQTTNPNGLPENAAKVRKKFSRESQSKKLNIIFEEEFN